jgi:hypothetical protein
MNRYEFWTAARAETDPAKAQKLRDEYDATFGRDGSAKPVRDVVAHEAEAATADPTAHNAVISNATAGAIRPGESE